MEPQFEQMQIVDEQPIVENNVVDEQQPIVENIVGVVNEQPENIDAVEQQQPEKSPFLPVVKILMVVDIIPNPTATSRRDANIEVKEDVLFVPRAYQRASILELVDKAHAGSNPLVQSRGGYNFDLVGRKSEDGKFEIEFKRLGFTRNGTIVYGEKSMIYLMDLEEAKASKLPIYKESNTGNCSKILVGNDELIDHCVFLSKDFNPMFNQCNMCENTADIIFQPCGHVIYCRECYDDDSKGVQNILKQIGCFLCKKPVVGISPL